MQRTQPPLKRLNRTATTCGNFFSVLPRTIPSLLLSAPSGTSTPQFVNNVNEAQITKPTRSCFIQTSK